MLYLTLNQRLMDEHCTIYFSRSTWAFNETELVTILQKSRRNNTMAGITGVLLYVRGSIMQVLEGETEAVETTFNRIRVDPRHTNVTRVMNRPINQRLFPAWTMGYETVTSQQMEDIKELLILDEFRGAAVTIKPEEPIILRLIKVFYDSNRYN